ncbi:hypothetical protein H0H93_004337 [Arthromyces matolae]|nr:hypothetical protein H0H93_004337 [Arthromyces matolae]
MAMWSKSNISRHLGLEEWSVFSVLDPIHMGTAHDGRDPYQLCYGDTFILKTLSIIEPDSPFFIIIKTWSTRNCEVLLRIPVGFVSTTVDSLLRHIDKTTLLSPGVKVLIPIASSSKEEQTKCKHIHRRANFVPNHDAVNEVGETTSPDNLSSISTNLFVQNASPVPSVAHSTPRYTAIEKGKGRVHALSHNLSIKTTPEPTEETSRSLENPNKRKAFETSTTPEYDPQNPHPITLPTEPGLPPPQTPPELPTAEGAAATFPPLPSNNLDLFSRLPLINNIERELETHIRLKPAFCGTKKEFNEHIMRLQELLAAISAMTNYTQNPSKQMYARSYQIPLLPQHNNPMDRDETAPDALLTPTPLPRNRTASHAGTLSSQHPNLGFPMRIRRSKWTMSPTLVNSDHRRHIPSVSPMDDEEDGVSIIDLIDWPERGHSLPSNIWVDKNIPPPYASSHNETPHQPPPNPNHPRSPSIATVTEIIFDPNDDMQIDVNPFFLWLPADTPGMVVAGFTRNTGTPPPTVSAKSLAVVADAPPHAIWLLMYRANGKNLDEQENVDAIRENVGKLIEIPTELA